MIAGFVYAFTLRQNVSKNKEEFELVKLVQEFQTTIIIC